MVLGWSLVYEPSLDPPDSVSKSATSLPNVHSKYPVDLKVQRAVDSGRERQSSKSTSSFLIPANSPRKYTAEVFLNFLLRPEITARIVNENYYPMANDAATPYIDPEILNDPVVYPTNAELQNAEILLPLSAEGEKLYAEIWERFMAAGD